MRNNHAKYVEINNVEHTIQILEKDRRGRVFGKSKPVEFNSTTDTMKLSLVMHGYKFHSSTRNGCLFDEVV